MSDWEKRIEEDLNWIARLQFRAMRVALSKRIERSPEFRERQRQARLADPLLITARVFATSSDDDGAVAARLRRHIKDPEAAEYALQQLERERALVGEEVAQPPGADDDRIYRILYAVVHGVPGR
ncbi:MAG TPA: hypothetical protein VFP55_07395 [Solirubrobacteraceae bacterium]|nr:hypothetical protein [Solirubrobacteraceae bacterium]